MKSNNSQPKFSLAEKKQIESKFSSQFNSINESIRSLYENIRIGRKNDYNNHRLPMFQKYCL